MNDAVDIKTLGGGVLSPLSSPLTDRPDLPPLPSTRADIKNDTHPPPVEKWRRSTLIVYWKSTLDEAKSRRSLKSYPKRIILIRHAESEGNIDNSICNYT
uniref:Uncharacterized protein n=1 Tax=Amphimedon queenslandica TaxID=400682 RepID=A0A1X7TKP9_AMPQE